MARKPQLPREIVRQIDSINRSAGEKFQTGDVMGSLRDALSAWELIPDVAWEDICRRYFGAMWRRGRVSRSFALIVSPNSTSRLSY